MGKSDAVSSTNQSDPKRSLDSRHLKTPSRLSFPHAQTLERVFVVCDSISFDSV